MANRIVERARRAIERLLPWFDRAERDRRAARTESLRKNAVNARIRSERILADPFRHELDGAVTAFRRRR